MVAKPITILGNYTDFNTQPTIGEHFGAARGWGTNVAQNKRKMGGPVPRFFDNTVASLCHSPGRPAFCYLSGSQTRLKRCLFVLQSSA